MIVVGLTGGIGAGQVDGVVDARRTWRGHRRRRQDRPRPAGAGTPAARRHGRPLRRPHHRRRRFARSSRGRGHRVQRQGRPRRPERHRPPGDAGRDPTPDRRPPPAPTGWSCSTSRCSARTRGWAWRRRSSSTSPSTSPSIVSSTSAAWTSTTRRARINSQITREERLATATHVIDNAGDVEALRQPGRRRCGRNSMPWPRCPTVTEPMVAAHRRLVDLGVRIRVAGRSVVARAHAGTAGDARRRLRRGRTDGVGPALELRRRSRHRDVAPAGRHG